VGEQADPDVAQELSQIHGLPPGGEESLVGFGEKQQLLDEVLEPPGLLDGAVGDDRPRSLVWVRQADLQGGADRGERAA
jgi:hypothetical protein